MYPILFSFGNFDIMTYYVMIGIGSIAGLLVLYFNIKSFPGDKKKKIYIFVLISFILVIIGSRVGYILESILQKKPFCASIIGPGSLWWGLVLATLSAFPVARILKVNEWEIADLFAISISIGGFFTRLGCFFNGCCFGIPVDENFPFATYYPYTTYAGKIFQDKPIHPTPLYLAFSWLFIFVILFFYKKHKKFHGELILIMAFLFSLTNFFIEFVRYHETQNLLSVSQIFSVIIFFTSILLYVLFKIYKINYLRKKQD